MIGQRLPSASVGAAVVHVLQRPAPEDEHVRGLHLAVDPGGVAVAGRGGVVGHDPAILVGVLLPGHGEEARVANRLLEAPHHLYGTLALVAPLLLGRQPVDGGGLVEQGVEDQVRQLPAKQGEPVRRQLVGVGRVAREEQDVAPAAAREPRRVEAPGDGDLQVGPLAEAPLPREEELRAEARLVPVLVAADGHQVARGRELEGHLADAAPVDGTGPAAGGHRLPLHAVLGLLKENEDILRAIVVPEVA
mmetsp:Transcript_33248/g.95234  ORF Transcript_33248/g.95234 Transcript_33248/m.95234 type:complete len:248 (+) Transcript_33248:3-746(+)